MTQQKEIIFIEDITVLENHWNETVKFCGNESLFSSYQWLKCWLDVYGTDYRQFIPCVKENGAIVAMAPLVIVPIKFLGVTLKVLKFIGDGSADYLDFTVRNDSDSCLKMLVDFIYDHHDKWDYCSFAPIVESSMTIKFLREYCLKLKMPNLVLQRTVSPYLMLDFRPEDLPKKVKKGLRYDLKRGEIELNKLGLVEYTEFTDRQEAISELRHFFNMLDTREEATGRVGSEYENALRKNIFKKYLENDLMRESVNFCRLSIDTLPIAYHFGFEFNQKLLWYKPAFDIKYSRFCVGKILIKKSIEYAIDKKYTEFDFLLGDEKYKYQWTNTSRKVFEFSMTNQMYTSRLFYFLINSVRPRLKNIKPSILNFSKRK